MFDLQTGILLLWTLFSLSRSAPLYDDQRTLQHSKYGRSLVLVGGNLQENNTEVYDTIIRMAVSLFKIAKKQHLDYIYYTKIHTLSSRCRFIPCFDDYHYTSQAGDADSSRAPGLTSGLQGSINVHRGTLLMVPQWQCISSFVFYIMILLKTWDPLVVHEICLPLLIKPLEVK